MNNVDSLRYTDGLEYEDVPEEVRREIVEAFAVLVTCENCANQYWTYEVPCHNSYPECDECGEKNAVIG